MRTPDIDETIFQFRMYRIRNGQRTGISENRGSFFETDAMFAQIRFRLARFPFKIEGHD